MSSEQADAQIALLQSMYAQDVEQSSRLVAVYTMQQVQAVELLFILVVVVVIGLAIAGLLRPRLL